MCTVIIGAGLTGLSTAWHLKEQNDEYQLYEKVRSPGGMGGSLRIEDTIFDLGAHIYYFQQADIKKLFLSLLNGACRHEEKRVKIHMNGYLVDYPYQANLHQLPAETRIESLGDLFLAAGQGDPPANFKDWLIKTYGHRMAHDFLIPHNEKLMCLPIEQMSTQWADRFFPKPNIKEIIAGAIHKVRDQFHPNQFFFYPEKGGAGQLSQIMAQRLPVNYGHKLVGIETQSQRVFFQNGHRIRYDRLVSTMPLPQLLGLLNPRQDWFAPLVERLRYSSLALVFIRTHRRSRLAVQGVQSVYYPQPDIPFQRLSFMENFSSHNAPRGQSGICLECSLPAGQKIPDTLVDDCLLTLETLNLCGRNDLLSVDRRYFPYGYPLYSATWGEDLQMVHAYLQGLHIISTGRYGRWQYSNMEDALRWGKEAATLCLTDPVSWTSGNGDGS